MTRRTWTALIAGGLVLTLGAFRAGAPMHHPLESAAARRTATKAEHSRAEPAGREDAAERAFAALETAELTEELPALVERADRFVGEHGGSTRAAEVRRRRGAYLLRIDERDIETARTRSASQPDEHAKRQACYQEYLDRHPAGAFVAEAREALATIGAEWQRQDYRRARDQFFTRPFDPAAVIALCRAYNAAHSRGAHRTLIADLQRWCERATVPGEYHVSLRSGAFGGGAKAWLSRGPRLAVEIEVGGVRHGPSPIAARGLEAAWDYEFPRRIRWKPGDSVVFRISDHWYWKRNVVTTRSDEDDPFAMRLLSNPIEIGEHTLVFESDFRMPDLPDE